MESRHLDIVLSMSSTVIMTEMNGASILHHPVYDELGYVMSDIDNLGFAARFVHSADGKVFLRLNSSKLTETQYPDLMVDRTTLGS